jgi:hypothetical protein
MSQNTQQMASTDQQKLWLDIQKFYDLHTNFLAGMGTYYAGLQKLLEKIDPQKKQQIDKLLEPTSALNASYNALMEEYEVLSKQTSNPVAVFKHFINSSSFRTYIKNREKAAAIDSKAIETALRGTGITLQTNINDPQGGAPLPIAQYLSLPANYFKNPTLITSEKILEMHKETISKIEVESAQRKIQASINEFFDYNRNFLTIMETFFGIFKEFAEIKKNIHAEPLKKLLQPYEELVTQKERFLKLFSPKTQDMNAFIACTTNNKDYEAFIKIAENLAQTQASLAQEIKNLKLDTQIIANSTVASYIIQPVQLIAREQLLVKTTQDLHKDLIKTQQEAGKKATAEQLATMETLDTIQKDLFTKGMTTNKSAAATAEEEYIDPIPYIKRLLLIKLPRYFVEDVILKGENFFSLPQNYDKLIKNGEKISDLLREASFDEDSFAKLINLFKQEKITLIDPNSKQPLTASNLKNLNVQYKQQLSERIYGTINRKIADLQALIKNLQQQTTAVTTIKDETRALVFEILSLDAGSTIGSFDTFYARLTIDQQGNKIDYSATIKDNLKDLYDNYKAQFVEDSLAVDTKKHADIIAEHNKLNDKKVAATEIKKYFAPNSKKDKSPITKTINSKIMQFYTIHNFIPSQKQIGKLIGIENYTKEEKDEIKDIISEAKKMQLLLLVKSPTLKANLRGVDNVKATTLLLHTSDILVKINHLTEASDKTNLKKYLKTLNVKYDDALLDKILSENKEALTAYITSIKQISNSSKGKLTPEDNTAIGNLAIGRAVSGIRGTELGYNAAKLLMVITKQSSDKFNVPPPTRQPPPPPTNANTKKDTNAQPLPKSPSPPSQTNKGFNGKTNASIFNVDSEYNPLLKNQDNKMG